MAKTTTIPIDPKVRDRLRAHGVAGMTYSQIIQRVLDRIDREEFFAELRRERDDPSREWVAVDELAWD